MSSAHCCISKYIRLHCKKFYQYFRLCVILQFHIKNLLVKILTLLNVKSKKYGRVYNVFQINNNKWVGLKYFI